MKQYFAQHKWAKVGHCVEKYYTFVHKISRRKGCGYEILFNFFPELRSSSFQILAYSPRIASRNSRRSTATDRRTPCHLPHNCYIAVRRWNDRICASWHISPIDRDPDHAITIELHRYLLPRSKRHSGLRARLHAQRERGLMRGLVAAGESQ